MRGDRRNAGAGNRHAGAEFDALGVMGGERHGGVAVRPDHLRVAYPGAVEAKLLGVANDVPIVDVRADANPELHEASPLFVQMNPGRGPRATGLILRPG